MLNAQLYTNSVTESLGEQNFLLRSRVDTIFIDHQHTIHH